MKPSRFSSLCDEINFSLKRGNITEEEISEITGLSPFMVKIIAEDGELAFKNSREAKSFFAKLKRASVLRGATSSEDRFTVLAGSLAFILSLLFLYVVAFWRGEERITIPALLDDNGIYYYTDPVSEGYFAGEGKPNFPVNPKAVYGYPLWKGNALVGECCPDEKTTGVEVKARKGYIRISHGISGWIENFETTLWLPPSTSIKVWFFGESVEISYRGKRVYYRCSFKSPFPVEVAITKEKNEFWPQKPAKGLEPPTC